MPYGTIEERFCKNFEYVSIKASQLNLQKMHNMAQKSRKKIKEWNKVCMDFGIFPRKLNILVNTR
jgi:hypothetical protein